MTRGLCDHGVKSLIIVGFNVYLPQIRITWVAGLCGCLVRVGRPILIVGGTFCQQPRRKTVAEGRLFLHVAWLAFPPALVWLTLLQLLLLIPLRTAGPVAPGFHCALRTSSSAGTFQDFQLQIGPAEHPAFLVALRDLLGCWPPQGEPAVLASRVWVSHWGTTLSHEHLFKPLASGVSASQLWGSYWYFDVNWLNVFLHSSHWSCSREPWLIHLKTWA